MISGSIKIRQSGAILIFSLLILLLISLLSVSMVEQNRVAFLMTGNAQQKTSTFSTAENILKLVENYIDETRYQTWPVTTPPVDYPDPAYTCKKTAGSPPKLDQIKPADITNSIGLSAAAIASGVVANISTTSCLLTGGLEVECTADGGEASGWSVNEINCHQNTTTFCPTEIYTINIKVTTDTGSSREIESKYAVRCDT